MNDSKNDRFRPVTPEQLRTIRRHAGYAEKPGFEPATRRAPEGSGGVILPFPQRDIWPKS